MSGLVHISKYLNEIKLEIDKYEQEMNERAENVSTQVKKIQEELEKIKMHPFSYWWTDRDEDHEFSISLSWNGTKVLYTFDNFNDSEVLLGTNRETRISVEKKLIPFLEEGLNKIQLKIAQLNS